jgi:drug/metabolite transporter (DMT)-like permease
MTDNLRGILAILASASAFAVNDALVKLATEELPTGEIIVIRGLLATWILSVATSVAGAWRPPHVLVQPAMAVRLVMSAFSTLLVVASLRHLPLATTAAILQMTPLVVTAGAALLLRAPVGWRRWAASLAGLSGVLLIVRPGSESFVPEVWIALSALLFTATRDLTTRFIAHAVPSLLVATASSAMVTLAGLALLPFETWVLPSERALLLLTAAASSLFVAYHLGIVAMRTGEIAVVAPFRYTLIILALILSYALWGHVPDAPAFTGIAVICGAGLYLLHRERLSQRRTGAGAPVTGPHPA